MGRCVESRRLMYTSKACRGGVLWVDGVDEGVDEVGR